MKNEKIDMSRESDTFHVSQDGVYTITGTNSRHGITVSAGVRATIFLQDVNLCDLGDMGVAFHIAENCHITVILEGNNILHSGREMAAIQLRKQSVLNIKGNGKLIAYGGEGAAGIGCGMWRHYYRKWNYRSLCGLSARDFLACRICWNRRCRSIRRSKK